MNSLQQLYADSEETWTRHCAITVVKGDTTRANVDTEGRSSAIAVDILATSTSSVNIRNSAM